MKRLSLYPAVVRIVQIVAGKRMPYIFHMHPDLMSAPCFQMKFSKGVFSANCQTFIMCYGRLPCFKIYFPGDH